MNKDIVLTELQIDEIKKTADKERRKFGIIDAPIAGDLFMLLEQEGIAICQYPFLTSEKSPLQMLILQDLKQVPTK